MAFFSKCEYLSHCCKILDRKVSANTFKLLKSSKSSSSCDLEYHSVCHSGVICVKRNPVSFSTSSTMASQINNYNSKMRGLMEENRTTKFFIEYRGFMSNHISHGLLALQKLEAPIERATKFIQWHGEKLEPADHHKTREREQEPMPADVDSIIGARKSFYGLFDHYTNLLREKYSGVIDDMIANEFPKLSSGMVGSALHGMIHLGYGYASGFPWFVCEGLAYLHYSFVPLELSTEPPPLASLGNGSTDILVVIEELRNDTQLISYMLEQVNEDKWTTKITSYFQRRTNVLFADRADALVHYVNKIRFPEELRGENFTLEKTPRLAKWLLDCAVIAYAIAEHPNDFFLLHGVTSAWALRNILVLLTNVDDVLSAARAYLCTLFSAYLAQNSPRLQLNLLAANPGLTYNWEDIVKRAIQHEQLEEEHIYKLVQVCKETDRENTDDTTRSIYRMAAYHCVTNPLTFE